VHVDVEQQLRELFGRGVGREPVGDARTIRFGQAEHGAQVANFSEPRFLGSLEPAHLAGVKAHAQDKGLALEVGFGSGHSLPHYDPDRVSRVIGIEPDAAMRHWASPQLRRSAVAVEIIDASGESVPIPSASADTVVMGYVLCTVPDPAACLAEAARVLKPGGQLLFCEHGIAEPGLRRRMQRRIDGLWGYLAGGCALLRDPLEHLHAAGFRCGELRQDRFTGLLGLLGRHVGGWAVPDTRGGRA